MPKLEKGDDSETITVGRFVALCEDPQVKNRDIIEAFSQVELEDKGDIGEVFNALKERPTALEAIEEEHFTRTGEEHINM